MKKLLALILVLAMVLCAVACAAPTAEAPKAEEPAAEAPKTEEPAAEAPAEEPAAEEAPAEEAQSFTVGLVLPMSGASANQGVVFETAAHFAYKYFMEEVGGFKNINCDFKMITVDTESNADVATSAVERIANDIQGAMGCWNTAATIAVSQVCMKYEIPFVNILSTADRTAAIESDYVYKVCVGDTEGNENIGEVWKFLESNDDHEYKSIAIIHGDDDYGMSSGEISFPAIAESLGWEVVTNSTLQSNVSTDASAAINKVKSSGADMLMTALLPNEAVLVQKQLREYQCNQPVYTGGSGYFESNFFANVQGAGDYVVSSVCWTEDMVANLDPSLKALDYCKAIEAEMKTPCQEGTAHSWLALACFIQAIEDSASVDPKVVAATINNFDLPKDWWGNLLTQFAGVKFDNKPGNAGTDMRYNINVYASVVFVQAQENTWKLVYQPGQVLENNPLIWPPKY